MAFIFVFQQTDGRHDVHGDFHWKRVQRKKPYIPRIHSSLLPCSQSFPNSYILQLSLMKKREKRKKLRTSNVKHNKLTLSQVGIESFTWQH